MREKFSVEEIAVSRITSEDDGWFFEVRPDEDALGCVEVKYFANESSEPRTQIMCSPACARLIAKAMIRVADVMEPIK